jgi:hypothetical protein
VGHICVSGPSATPANQLTFFGGAFTPASTDLAENYSDIKNQLNPGDVVRIDPTGFKAVTKSNGSYDSGAIGVISTSPGVLLSGIDETHNTDLKHPKAVALAGRVPTKFSAENGDVQAGDYLTSSATKPGYAMRATRAGKAIGQALESSNGDGMVVVFVHSDWYEPADAPTPQTSNNNLQQNGNMTFASLNVDSEATVNDLSVTSSATIAKLTVTGALTTDSLTVNGHIISVGKAPSVKGSACDLKVTVQGTDTTGLVIVKTAKSCSINGALAAVKFNKAYGKAPFITLTPANANAANIKAYVDSGAVSKTSFDIAASRTKLGNHTEYRWYYQVIQ